MVSSLLPLRPYQDDALTAFTEKVKRDKMNRLAIVLPTGGGKTICFAHQAARHLKEHPDERVLVLVHTDELSEQARKKILDVAPHLTVGIVKARRNDVRADVIIGSVQTLRNENRRNQIRHVGLVIVDECHHATAATYRAILTHFGCFGDRVVTAGYTATLTRSDGAALGAIWQDVAFSRDISWMVRRKYLIPPRGKAVEVPDLDLSKVKSTRTDYREGELGEALADSLAPQVVAQKVKELASDRKILAFFPTVASAYVFAEAFDAEGIQCEVIHGELPLEERRAILDRHKRGGVIANCMVLTEGYDDPEVDCIVIGRPTKSKGLYIQIVGRGLRVDPARPYEKQDCLLLDVVGVSARHDLRSIADLSEKPVKDDGSGKTLIEMEDLLDSGEGVEEDAPTFYEGPVEIRDFDPLAARSSKTWNHTKGGVFFIAAGKWEGYVFLVPSPHKTYSVAWCSKTSNQKMYWCGEVARMKCVHEPKHSLMFGGFTEHQNLTLEVAMAWAEDLVLDMATSLAPSKKAAWRKREASQDAKWTALSNGAKTHQVEGRSAGEVSDLIDRLVASRRIDPIVAHLKKEAS